MLSRVALERNRRDIDALLDQLPEPFHQDTGGGWSFLNMCDDKDGNQWTGLHLVQEKLVVLGRGVDRIHFLLPRELWPVLPGSVPYIMISSRTR